MSMPLGGLDTTVEAVTARVLICEVASCTTSKVAELPATAVALVVAITAGLEELALVAVQACCTAVAASCRAESLELMVWYALITLCWVESWFFSAVCGCAARVISWEISEVVSMPDDSPLIEKVLT